MSVILVTGTGKGIGAAVAAALEQAGETVIAHYRTTQSEATTQAALTCQGDLTRSADVEQMVRQISATYDHLDGLINTIGEFGPYQILTEITSEQFEQVLRSNIITVQLCTQAALPLLKHSASGRIINFACAQAEYHLARTFTVPYYIAKSGVVTLTKSWAKLLVADPITVNAIAPGVVEHSQVVPASATDRIVKLEEIVAAVQFLLSPSASGISGAVIEVSKSWTP